MIFGDDASELTIVDFNVLKGSVVCGIVNDNVGIQLIRIVTNHVNVIDGNVLNNRTDFIGLNHNAANEWIDHRDVFNQCIFEFTIDDVNHCVIGGVSIDAALMGIVVELDVLKGSTRHPDVFSSNPFKVGVLNMDVV